MEQMTRKQLEEEVACLRFMLRAQHTLFTWQHGIKDATLFEEFSKLYMKWAVLSYNHLELREEYEKMKNMRGTSGAECVEFEMVISGILRERSGNGSEKGT